MGCPSVQCAAVLTVHATLHVAVALPHTRPLAHSATLKGTTQLK